MSTPIFDALFDESDEATRALVWEAVRPTVSVKITPGTSGISLALAGMVKAVRAGMAMENAMTGVQYTLSRTSAEVRDDGLLRGMS